MTSIAGFVLECLILVTMMSAAILIPLGATPTMRSAKMGSYVRSAAVLTTTVGMIAALLMFRGILLRLPGFP